MSANGRGDCLWGWRPPGSEEKICSFPVSNCIEGFGGKEQLGGDHDHSRVDFLVEEDTPQKKKFPRKKDP